NETDKFVIRAPLNAGGYTWLAVYEATSAPISISVKAHSTSIVVWDIPTAVVIGERFRAKVGIKWSSEGNLTNRVFETYDHKGRAVATGTLSGGQWPGTALYFAEIEVQAPAEEGLYTWSVKCLGSDAGLPHAEGSATFGVRAVSPAEYVVTV